MEHTTFHSILDRFYLADVLMFVMSENAKLIHFRYFSPDVSLIALPTHWRVAVAHSVYQLSMLRTTVGSELELWQGHKCSFPHLVYSDSLVHPASYSMGTGALSSGIKRAENEAGHSHPTVPRLRTLSSVHPFPIA
jgi:hypothetical protein